MATASGIGASPPKTEEEKVKEAPKDAAKDAKEAPQFTEFSDTEFIRFLVNEDISCPVCYRAYLPFDIRDLDGVNDYREKVTEIQLKEKLEALKKKDPSALNLDEWLAAGYVIPILTDCNHAICKDCALRHFERGIVFIKGGSGVRCRYHKRDQLGHPSVYCNFLTPCAEIGDLSVSGECMLIAKGLRDNYVALGVKNPDYDGDKEFYYYFKYCWHCQKESKFVCTKCMKPFCDACKDKHAGHAQMPVEEFEKSKIQCHKCQACSEKGKDTAAHKFCCKCKKYLCRNRKTCYDPCMDPDHLLMEFDPDLIELKRFEYNAVDNSRKMFIHDVHDYLETDPFFWQAADMESLSRTMWYQEHRRCVPVKPGEEEEVEEEVEEVEEVEEEGDEEEESDDEE